MKIKGNKGITYIIIAIQILDILVHLLTNQFELIRVISNTVVILWVIILQLNLHKIVLNLLTTIMISIYIILNGLFLLANGIYNPNNQSLRIPLLLFVLSSVILIFVRYIKVIFEPKRM